MLDHDHLQSGFKAPMLLAPEELEEFRVSVQLTQFNLKVMGLSFSLILCCLSLSSSETLVSAQVQWAVCSGPACVSPRTPSLPFRVYMVR